MTSVLDFKPPVGVALPASWLPDRSKFTTSNGIKYTQRLFLEQSYGYNDRSMVQYTLKNRDHDGYRSLYLCYMDEADVTELSFARKYLDGWAHWLMLCECEWFKPIVARWREELLLQQRSRTLRQLEEEASDPDSKNRFEAKKVLFVHSWKDYKSETKRVGRPNKTEVTDPENKAETEEDLKRMKEG